MAIEVVHDTKSGKWSFSYKRHVLVAIGLVFITGGIAVFTGPWWQGLLVALLGTVDIAVPETNQSLIGIALILIGLVFVGYKYLVVDVHEANVSADRATLASALISIDLIRGHFQTILNDHSYKSSLDTVFYNSYTHFLNEENAFKVQGLSSAYRRYSDAAAELHQFCWQHFSVFPNVQPQDIDYRYCMAPDLNVDRGMVIYDQDKATRYEFLSKQLDSLVANASSSFDMLVKELKKYGHV